MHPETAMPLTDVRMTSRAYPKSVQVMTAVKMALTLTRMGVRASAVSVDDVKMYNIHRETYLDRQSKSNDDGTRHAEPADAPRTYSLVIYFYPDIQSTHRRFASLSNIDERAVPWHVYGRLLHV